MVPPTPDPMGSDRVAIVTGGSRGVGQAVTRKLAGRGYSVVVNYAQNQGAADATVEEILAANGTALAVRGDVADELDVERLFEETTKAFGGVDVVVHTVRRAIVAPAADADLEVFDALQRTNVRGTFVVNRQASWHLRDGGSLINLSGVVGGQALTSAAAHASSNAAIEAITRVLARELRERGITVNDIAPGLGLPCTPAEVADIVAFLVGQTGHSISGHVVRVDSTHGTQFTARSRKDKP